MLNCLQLVRTFASSTRIITRYEDLPADYEDLDGLAYRHVPLSEKEAKDLFGKGMEVGKADRILRIVHGRRVAGTLDDAVLLPDPGFESMLTKISLAWLRKHVPVDEIHAAGLRAEEELRSIQDEVLIDAEKLGLYKPKSGEVSGGEKDSAASQSVYGRGVLDEIREKNERRAAEEERAQELAKQTQADEIRENSGTLSTQTVSSRVELRRPGENPRLKYYLERAKVAPDVPPEMTAVQRLWRSALVAALITASMVLFTTVYTPPNKSARMAPDIPPAAATVGALIAVNTLVFMLWRFPPAFRMLNMYFISVPGYPRALAVLGNTFSHQSFSHLAWNMVVLWFVGTRLHDDIGRANFLAIYFSSAVFSTLSSLTYYTLRANFVTSSMGASGAIAGLLAAYMWLHRTEYFKPLGLPPDPYPGISGSGLLCFMVLLEVFQMRRRPTGHLLDHYAHLGGYATGIAGMELIKRYTNIRKEAAMRHQKRSVSDQQHLQRSMKTLKDKWTGGKGEGQ